MYLCISKLSTSFDTNKLIRSGNYNPDTLFVTMNNIDNYVCDNSPIVDKYYIKYDKIFTD